MRFWDTSAVVPLIVEEECSSQASRWLAEDPEVVLWILTPVELTSALCRLVRDGGISEVEAERAEKRVDELYGTCHRVVQVDTVILQARRLLRLHPLRAADALQLAAALQWADGRPMGRRLHTFDVQLARAAVREGFAV